MPLKDAVLEGHSRTCPPSPQSVTTSERIGLRGNFQKCKSETDTNPHVAVDRCSLRWGKPTPSSYHQQQSPRELTRRSPCKKFFLITKNTFLNCSCGAGEPLLYPTRTSINPHGTVGRALHRSAAQIPAESTQQPQRKAHPDAKQGNSKENGQPSLVHLGGFAFLVGKKSPIIVMAFLYTLRSL